MPIFKQTLADANSTPLGWDINSETEVSVHTGASEALLSIIMAFIEPGEEVILLEPFFSAYVAQEPPPPLPPPTPNFVVATNSNIVILCILNMRMVFPDLCRCIHQPEPKPGGHLEMTGRWI